MRADRVNLFGLFTMQRFGAFSRQLHVEYVDMDVAPTRAALLTKRYGVNPAELREGVIVAASALPR